MMKKCLGIALTVIVLSTSAVRAQSYAETALLFSRTQSAGSARIQAMGGAQTALGGDFSSALSNPAGLGMYNRSEFTFSPALSFYNTKATYDTRSGVSNPSVSESLTKFNIPGISYVMHLPSDKNGYVGGSFGISFSRTNDYNSDIRYNGVNTRNSITDFFIEQANGIPASAFDESAPLDVTDLAYWNYLIGPTIITDPNGFEDDYFTDAPSANQGNANSLQQEEIKTRRASNQWSFSYGGNYKDIFFFGGGIGLTTLRYTSEKTYSEDYRYSGGVEPIRQMTLNEALDIRGSGINATIGAIVRPVQFFQFGLSFTTPTFYQLTENYNARMNTSWNDFDYDDETTLNEVDDSTGPITSEYNLSTPLKLSAGFAFISKFGLLTVDVEKMNAGKAKYSSDIAGISYANENNEIRDLYKNAFSYRIGVEGRYESFRLRGGYGVQASSYQNNDLDNSVQTLSGGIGFRKKTFALDFAVINRKSESYYSPYTLFDGLEPVAKFKTNNLTTMLTFSLFF